MRDALRDANVRADPEQTIDAADPANDARPDALANTLPGEVVATTRDYPQLVAVERHHYVIGKEIAKGGMGRVLEARDLRLGRQIAIKELLPKNRDIARRFEREARITARLQHPSIIHVYEAGVWPGGEPFYAMPKVSGRSLDKVVAERATFEDRLGLLPNVIAVADALAYAHNENVIHRDLKPANVLVGEFGETVVIDWGLAKDLGELGAPTDPKESMQLRVRVAAEGAAGPETVSGSVVGTPAYMPPEQARGETVDQRADVYALGALLYKVLAGAPPYRADSTTDVVERVKAGPPVPIRELAPMAPKELVAIVEKAMARDPIDRYPTASALAQDLKRFETGQLVGAHRYTIGQLVRRWLRRNRVVVGVSLAALVAMIAIGVVSVRRIVSESQRAERERVKAVAGRVQLLEEHGRTALLAGHAGAALAYLVGAAEDGASGGARGFLIADAMRPFIAELAHHTVGRGHVAVAVSHDGRLVASGGAGPIDVRDAAGKLLHSFGEHGVTSVVALDAGTTHLVAAGDDGVARVWKLDGTVVAELRGHAGPILDAAFSPDGRRLATAGSDATVRIWDLASQTAAISRCHTAPVVSVRWSPDAARILTASADATACIVPSQSCTSCVIDRDAITPLRGHTGPLTTASWSPDARYAITASSDGTARVWHADRGKLAVAPLRHRQGSSVEVGLLASEDRAITAGSDANIHVWQMPSEIPLDGTPATAKLVKTLTGHTGAIVCAALGADDAYLATGSFDGLAKIWDVDAGEAIATFEHGDVVTAAAFLAEQPALATGSRDGTLRIWDTRIAKVRHELDSEIHALAVSGGHVVAAGTDDSRVTLVRGDRTTQLVGHLGRVFALAFTPDGTQLVSAGDDAAAFVWNVATGQRIRTLADHAVATRALAFDPRGEILAMLVGDTVELWSFARGARVGVLARAGLPIDALAFDPSGNAIATTGRDGSLVLWDRAGNVVSGGTEPAAPYTSLAFAPDGKTLVAAGIGVAHVWRLANGKLAGIAMMIEAPTGAVRAVAITTDGSRLISAADEGGARIWDANKGKLLGTRDRQDVAINALVVDGDTLWLAGKDGTLGAWDIRVDTRPVAELREFMREKHILERLDRDDVVRHGESR